MLRSSGSNKAATSLTFLMRECCTSSPHTTKPQSVRPNTFLNLQWLCYVAAILLIVLASSGDSFLKTKVQVSMFRMHEIKLSMNLASRIVGAVMESPLYGPIVNTARNSMKETVKNIGINWEETAEAIRNSDDWEARVNDIKQENPDIRVGNYYLQRFHGYEKGNLCIESAIEQEIAGKAVGARNFPEYGKDGEAKLRTSFLTEIVALGGQLPDAVVCNQTVVDIGCGTGTSTRQLAALYPSAKEIIGIDCSPYMLAVGRFLQTEVPKGKINWVDNSIDDDCRISLRYAMGESTGLPDKSAMHVNICFILHELPETASKAMIQEAFRVLKPGGVVTIMEMDPSAPGYKKLRANPMLFSILRSTEPYLDQYFDIVAPQLPTLLQDAGFDVIRMSAATGRHFALVALKPGIVDARPSTKQ